MICVQRTGSGRWRAHAAALLSLLAMPFAEAGESPPSQLTTAIAQLRQAVGLWDVTTTRYGEDGAVAGVASGTYRFDWIVPDAYSRGVPRSRSGNRMPASCST